MPNIWYIGWHGKKGRLHSGLCRPTEWSTHDACWGFEPVECDYSLSKPWKCSLFSISTYRRNGLQKEVCRLMLLPHFPGQFNEKCALDPRIFRSKWTKQSISFDHAHIINHSEKLSETKRHPPSITLGARGSSLSPANCGCGRERLGTRLFRASAQPRSQPLAATATVGCRERAISSTQG